MSSWRFFSLSFHIFLSILKLWSSRVVKHPSSNCYPVFIIIFRVRDIPYVQDCRENITNTLYRFIATARHAPSRIVPDAFLVGDTLPAIGCLAIGVSPYKTRSTLEEAKKRSQDLTKNTWAVRPFQSAVYGPIFSPLPVAEPKACWKNGW